LTIAAQTRSARRDDGSVRSPGKSTGRAPVEAMPWRVTEAMPLFRCACGGACPRCRGSTLHPKLAINTPGDAFEREADRAADAVMAGSRVEVARSASTTIRRCACGGRCSTCRQKQKEEEEVRREPASTRGQPGFAPAIVHEVLAAPGRALPSATREFMEGHFGADFGGVRIHHDGQAAESARVVDAHAYTVGNDVVFGAGRYAPGTVAGDRLLAHELAHTLQQGSPGDLRRATGGTAGTGSGGSSSRGGASTGAPGGGGRRMSVDVLASERPDDFLVRAASEALGVDLRVRGMDDMVTRIRGLVGASRCVERLTIYNHGNPDVQVVSGGHKAKQAGGGSSTTPVRGFSLSWLLSDANRSDLERLRGSLCCSPEMVWRGCVTSGVWAHGGTRTEAELRSDRSRYTEYRAGFYHSVEDALAHGAVDIAQIGQVNAQSWADATCAAITAADDLVHWDSSRRRVRTYVGHGGRWARYAPRPDAGCACDPATGRVGGTALSRAELSRRAVALREELLAPAATRARARLGAEPNVPAETEEVRRDRQRFESERAEFLRTLGQSIRSAVLERTGFAAGASITTADEALRVTALWGVGIADLESAVPAIGAATAGAERGSRAAADVGARQRQLEAALTPQGRETLTEALLSLQREAFWRRFLSSHAVYVYPDLAGTGRYRGYTQRGTGHSRGGGAFPVYIIHLQKAMLDGGERELAAATLVHELSHNLYEPTLEGAMRSFHVELAERLADHPRIAARRSGAHDAAAARAQHVTAIRQFLHERTSYGEEEIFVYLQQLTHMPDQVSTPDGRVQGSRYVLAIVEHYVRQLRRIGAPGALITGVLGSMARRTELLYDRRIAAAAAGSSERRRLELDRQLALSLFRLALSDAGGAP